MERRHEHADEAAYADEYEVRARERPASARRRASAPSPSALG